MANTKSHKALSEKLKTKLSQDAMMYYTWGYSGTEATTRGMTVLDDLRKYEGRLRVLGPMIEMRGNASSAADLRISVDAVLKEGVRLPPEYGWTRRVSFSISGLVFGIPDGIW
jgi:hypothetical protein